jgi:hypothetical protein
LGSEFPNFDGDLADSFWSKPFSYVNTFWPRDRAKVRERWLQSVDLNFVETA